MGAPAGNGIDVGQIGTKRPRLAKFLSPFEYVPYSPKSDFYRV